MKSMFAVVALVLVGVLIQRGVTSEPRLDLPPGVQESEWIRLTDNAGFLIIPEKPTAYESPGGRQVLTGHFFAKKDGKWYRLNVAPVGTIVHTR